jgi:dimethylaniline monooxygenase (N-oxide forming)
MDRRVCIYAHLPLFAAYLCTYLSICLDTDRWMSRLWNYSEDESLSVASTTIFNSSKYRSAISDYPFPGDTDDFPTWRQMLEYLQGYADNFQLGPHIQLNTRVTHISREGDAWAVELLTKDGTRCEYFDKVAVANGTFTAPKTPKLPGIEQFSGRALHAINFHRPETFKDQRVLLIGLHASAQDVAMNLSGHAAQVYASHRNGIVLVCYTTVTTKRLIVWTWSLIKSSSLGMTPRVLWPMQP